MELPRRGLPGQAGPGLEREARLCKYFVFEGKTTLQIALRGQAAGTLSVLLDDAAQGEIEITPDAAWHTVYLPLNARGTHALYLEYQGEGSLDIMDLTFA